LEQNRNTDAQHNGIKLEHLTRVAIHDAKNPSLDGAGQRLRIVMDGIDQAKFRLPRNTAGAADLEPLWRPALHVTGVIIHGHIEVYYIMDTDRPKDANMNCTVLMRSLDILQEQSFSDHQFAMPRDVEIQTDNTAREGVNQTFAILNAYLNAADMFDQTLNARQTVGHTHNEQDQRFSVACTTMSRAPVLEDPEETAQWLRDNLPPAGGRC